MSMKDAARAGNPRRDDKRDPAGVVKDALEQYPDLPDQDHSPDHPWVALCERAQCSPDFDVVYGFNRTQACNWLRNRLLERARSVAIRDVREAYDKWPHKSDGEA